MNISEQELTITNNSVKENENNNKLYKVKFRNILNRTVKRGIDIVAGIIGCMLLVPITLFVVAANLVNRENGPIFFIQERIGKNGKAFKMYKFRTMVVGAEDILRKHIEEQTEIGKEYIKHKKIKNDPRITKAGKWLRETSLDEFPQFVNVIMGQMSLVGPRPYLPREKEEMGEYYRYIVGTKPGLTGPWQVAGRNNVGFSDRLELDKKYIENYGNRHDLKIIFKTIKKVVKKEGAI